MHFNWLILDHAMPCSSNDAIIDHLGTTCDAEVRWVGRWCALNRDPTCTPAELMYMRIGFVGLSYCRYISSANSNSVTAGTKDIPCSAHKFAHFAITACPSPFSQQELTSESFWNNDERFSSLRDQGTGTNQARGCVDETLNIRKGAVCGANECFLQCQKNVGAMTNPDFKLVMQWSGSFETHQIYYPLFEKEGWKVRGRLLCCISWQHWNHLQ